MRYDAANFSPIMKGYSGQGAFRFWCQTVLPLVYDDSLSYYELLNKVVVYLNNTIADVANVESNITALHNAYEQLEDYVNTYFDNLDVQEEINNKLDEMVADGTMSSLIVGLAGRLNVKSFVEGDLTSDNIGNAIITALEYSNYIYIPAGDYENVNLTIVGTDGVKKCDFLIDDHAYFSKDDNEDYPWVFRFENCSVTIKGGNFNSKAYVEKRSLFGGVLHGMIELYNCEYNVIDGIKSTNSKHGSVITIEDSKHNVISNCQFDSFLMSAIHILYTCDDTKVTKCKFSNVYIPSGDYYYCYFVYTGVRNIGEARVAVPPTGIEYSYNCGENSPDSGLDTHGAQNVNIFNNVIKNCATPITAYNDWHRVNRPAGWVMKNVVIRNNICISNVENPEHSISYIFTSNNFEHNVVYENYIIENNHFENTVTSEQLINIQCIRNAIIRNNILIGNSNMRYLTWVMSCQNIIFSNNVMRGGSEANIRFDHCNGEFDNNTGDNTVMYLEGTNNYNYMKGSQKYVNALAPRMLTYGDTYTYSGRNYQVTSYGLRVRPNAYSIASITGTTSNNLFTTTGTVRFVSGQTISIDNVICIVDDVKDQYNFTFRTSGTVADGEHTASAVDFTTYDLSTLAVRNVVDNTVSANTYLTAGLYYCDGKMLDTPVSDATSFTQLTVERFGSSTVRQIVYGDTSGEFWVRTASANTQGQWYHYTATN